MSDETEKLIDLVKVCGFLYDPRHPEYKDVSKKTQKWAEIAQELNMNCEVAKLRWKSLRDSYVKYLKFVTGTPGTYKKFRNWPWASNMEFLQDSLNVRANHSNEPGFIDTEIPLVETNCEELKSSENVSPMSPPIKKSKPMDAAGVETILNFRENETQNIHKNLDRTDLLFLSYAETLKKFSSRRQAVIKMEIALMFGRAELREMEAQTESTSVPINSSPPTLAAEIETGLHHTSRQFCTSPTDSGSGWFEFVKEELQENEQ